MFYSDAGLPTLSSDNRIISRNVTLINIFHCSITTILSNNPLSFLTGHWFSKHWVNAQANKWFNPAVEATFQVTLTVTQTVHKPLPEHLLEEWQSSWTRPPPRDPCRHFTPLGEPPDTTLHPFVQGVLTANSHTLQSTAFQLITGHCFDARYSSCFRANTGDNITCPHCSNCYTVNHVLFDCDHFWYE